MDSKSARAAGVPSRISSAIAHQFYRLGILVATHAWNTVIVSFLLVGVCCVGFIRFKLETDPLELWVPTNSEFVQNSKWIMNHIEFGFRPQSVLIRAPNVLEPTVLFKLATIHHKLSDSVATLRNGTQVKWNDICFKVPFVTGVPDVSRRRRDIDFDDSEFGDLFEEAANLQAKPVREFNPSIDVNPDIYCRFVNGLPFGCYERNILELWEYDIDRISKLTLEDVIQAVHNTTASPVSGHDTNFTKLLGDVQKDDKGRVVSAAALQTIWYVYLDFKQIDKVELGNLAGTEKWLTEESAAWENVFLNELHNISYELSDNETKIYYQAAKSFGDISHDAMFKETDKLIPGITIMFTFMLLVLSKFSWVEMRISLCSVGLLSIGMSFISACGICSAIGISYGPVHTSLPFLLMGLGVDDLFVIMACWRKVQHEQGSIEERIGLMLKHAGASITVTSFTDIIAFFVGSSTVIPSLQSFCLYAAVGVFMTYFFAITFFVALFTIDEYRIQANRNSFVPCLVHREETKPACQLNLMRRSLNAVYTKFILTKPGKAIIILTVICMTSLSGVHVFKLEQKFDPAWFIPESTYLHKFISNFRLYFPDSGYRGSVFMGKLNYTESLPKILHLVDEIDNNTDLFYGAKSWIKPFSQFTKTYFHKDISKETLSDHEWRHYLSKFLFSPNWGIYQANFRFDKALKCGEPTPDVTVSWIDFQFRLFETRDEKVFAMHRIEEMVKNHNLTSGDGYAASWSVLFANWITDEIIDTEILRNVSLAMICVMLCTFVVILDFQVCFWIFVCVVLTLINVSGFMQIWGLTIDLVSCIGLQLSIGLCVDYAAHIGHTFLVMSNGGRDQRSLDAVQHIGSAVLYGGGSTLLALSLLSQSDAYTFQSFFKIFFLVISFGLFHGVVLLPVILSLVGSKPFVKVVNDSIKEEEMQPMNQSNDKKYPHDDLGENEKFSL